MAIKNHDDSYDCNDSLDNHNCNLQLIMEVAVNHGGYW